MYGAISSNVVQGKVLLDVEACMLASVKTQKIWFERQRVPSSKSFHHCSPDQLDSAPTTSKAYSRLSLKFLSSDARKFATERKHLILWNATAPMRVIWHCIDHQTFACLCMRGRGRKVVAIQTEACVCSWGRVAARNRATTY